MLGVSHYEIRNASGRFWKRSQDIQSNFLKGSCCEVKKERVGVNAARFTTIRRWDRHSSVALRGEPKRREKVLG